MVCELSIITINFNNKAGLKRTLNSFRENVKGKSKVEFIIIDGASSDGSVDIANIFFKERSNCKLTSEIDTGIYNAMNKGIAQSSGKYLAFLNSGDSLAAHNIIEDILVKLRENPEKIGFFGDVVFKTFPSNRVVRYWKAGEMSLPKILCGWMPPHPMCVIKRSKIQAVGGFDENFKISADYDLMLRVFWPLKFDVIYLDKLLVCMEAGGVSNGSFKQILVANLEVIKAWKKRGRHFFPFWIFLTKPLMKFRQLFTLNNYKF